MLSMQPKTRSRPSLRENRIRCKCKAKVQGFASKFLDFHSEPIKIQLAGFTFYDCRYLIVVNDVPLLAVSPPEVGGQPVLLTGRFADTTGKVSLTIEDNAFYANAWDVECVGPRITIRKAKGDVSLVLRLEPPTGLVVEQLDMFFQGVYFRGNLDVLEMSMDGKTWNRWQVCGASHSVVGILIENSKWPANDPLYATENQN